MFWYCCWLKKKNKAGVSVPVGEGLKGGARNNGLWFSGKHRIQHDATHVYFKLLKKLVYCGLDSLLHRAAVGSLKELVWLQLTESQGGSTCFKPQHNLKQPGCCSSFCLPAVIPQGSHTRAEWGLSVPARYHLRAPHTSSILRWAALAAFWPLLWNSGTPKGPVNKSECDTYIAIAWEIAWDHAAEDCIIIHLHKG